MSRNLIISDIFEEHFEEVGILWNLRQRAIYSSAYSLKDLEELEERIAAHIDGLMVGGEPGWEICKQLLSWEEVGELFAAAVLAFESGNDHHIEQVLNTENLSLELASGVISALGWLTYEKAQPHIQSLLKSAESVRRRIGVASSAVHRQDPGDVMNKAISSANPEVRSRILRAAGELGRCDLLPQCRNNMAEEQEDCCFWAAWSVALLGDEMASEVLREFALGKGIRAERACDLATRRMQQAEAFDWQNQLARQEEYLRLAIISAEAIGDPALVPWLINMMKNHELARVAGEAFTMITGVDIAYEDLEGEWPEGFEVGPTEDPEDENVDMDPDEDLPWPEPEAIQAWWYNHRGQFQRGTRYLLGNPMSTAWLQDVLRNGYQRQRAAAALELAMRHPGQPLFEVRAPGFRQQQLLHENPGQYRI